MADVETTDPFSVRPEQRPGVGVKLFYAIGNVAEQAFVTAVAFVFFYYTAVLGLSGSLVGLALFVGLCADAGVDPFIGSWSDNLETRLGRRIPLMVVAAPLLAVSFGLMLSPPQGLSDLGLTAWLAVTAVATRSFISLFHVPYVALGAEMASGYAERSSVVAYRAVAGILAGVVVTALAYSVFFAGEGGLQRPQNYPGFGWSISLMMLVGIAICCLGVARYASRLPQVTPVARPLLARLPGEVAEIFRNRSFRILFFSALVAYTAVGINATLNGHAYVFLWRLRPETIQLIAYAYLAGLLVGVPIAPLLAARMEKKTVVVVGLGLIILAWTVLPLLRAAGLITPAGVEALPWLAANVAIAGVGSAFTAIAYPSMMADAADEHEHLFGRRREGLYFAGLGFAFKAATGVGVLLAGFGLDFLKFPREAGRTVGAVLPEDVLVPLTLAWAPVPAVLGMVSLVLFFAYGISQRRHAEIAAALRLRAA